MTYVYTNQRALRKAFWDEFPDLPRRTIRDYAGTGRMYTADTRCTWVDWVDSLCRDGHISPNLAERANLRA